ncbi:MAG TPA: hypothetical protein VL970_05685 [Candidatus Acidoferrales bacterium]|nr:hypothetical protein [Candidatus Acidoferrales bacterium]
MVLVPGHSRPGAPAGQSCMVYAPDLRQAQGHFQTILTALHPAKPPQILPANRWKPAPRPLQPDGPVRPGCKDSGNKP